MIITVTLNPAMDKVYWVDHLRLGRVTQEEFLTRALESDTSAGGKGINISVFLARLEVENIAMGFAGEDTGHVVVRYLREEGVATNFVWVNGETRTNVIILERGRENVPILVDEEGPAVSPDEIARFLRRYQRMLHRASWVVLAGTLPPGVDADFYRLLTEMALKVGVKVAVSARGHALTRVLRAAPSLVKPDTREQLAIEGTPITTEEEIISAGEQIISTGVSVVIVSHEVTGDIAITADGILQIDAPINTTQFKNLVGADDVFLGGVIHCLDRGDELEQALRFGLAAAMVSAQSKEKIVADEEKINVEMENITVQKMQRGQG